MSEQNIFFALVKQDMKRRKRRRPILTGRWLLAYAVIIAIVVFVLATYAALNMNIDINYVWFFTFGFPFMAFGMATSLTVHEWRNNTSGWWLSLPISRLELVTSKFTATLLRAVISFALIYGAIVLLALYTLILQNSFTLQTVVPFLENGIKWNILFISICPFVAAFGVLFGVLTESRMKPAIPLLWISFVGLWWLIFSRSGDFLKIQESGIAVAPSFSVTFLYPIVSSWMIAYLLIRLAAYLLEKQSAL